MSDDRIVLLGRIPSPPDQRDYRLENFLRLGTVGSTDTDAASLIALGVSELRKTTITYAKWAATVYPNVRITHWWKALDAFARAQALLTGVTPPPVGTVVWDNPEPVLDQGNYGTCLKPGTLVRMADGSERAVEDVRLGEYVVTAEGHTGMVRQTMVRMETEGIFRLSLWGYRSLCMTAEHPVLTERGYVPISELRFDDIVAMPRYRSARVRDKIDTSSFVSRSEWTLKRGKRVYESARQRGTVAVSVSKITATIALTPRFGRLVGLFLAEGSTSKGKAIWTFGAHEEDTLVAETVDLLADLGVEARVQHRPNNSINVNAYGTEWARLWAALCGTGSGEKTLAPALCEGSDAFLAAILEGWMSGDGNTHRSGTRTGVSVSKRLAMAMFDIAQSLGLRPLWYTRKPSPNQHAKTRRVSYHVSLDAPDLRSYQDDTHVWRKVRAIEQEEFAGFVYNLSVDGDESYVAEGIAVHNCVGNGYAQWGNTLPVDDKFTEKDARAIYYETTVIDGWPDDPDAPGGGQQGATVRSGAKAMQNRGRLSAYAFAASTSAVTQWIQQNGPVVIGVNWYTGMFDTDTNGFVNVTGQVEGGHCVVLRGYLPTEGAYLGENSWGSSWGDQGNFKIKVTDFGRLLSEDGEAVAAVELPLAA